MSENVLEDSMKHTATLSNQKIFKIYNEFHKEKKITTITGLLNLLSEWSHVEMGCRPVINTQPGSVDFVFDTVDLAVMFKMRWA